MIQSLTLQKILVKFLFMFFHPTEPANEYSQHGFESLKNVFNICTSLPSISFIMYSFN